ncbi:hypothetical protein [Afipia carboxidovorans]|uniref:hypothetical protein n=1 Tax=Afipia carboxidovorans TaxID=40137 RepID=UPI00308E4FCE|nr:hypothetical protein CRBSH125_05640 [Afipia carboxidovorans]
MTSAAKHTAGPWEVVPLSGCGGPYAIRMAYASDNPRASKTYYGVQGVGTEANARLIAAAPDMRDVCAAFSVTNEGGIVTLRSNGRTIARASSRSDTGKELLRLGRLRRTALAKAEGGAK